MSWRAWAVVYQLTTAVLLAAPFAPPLESPVAFRRDRLPIDVDTMHALSDDLLTIAKSLKPGTATDRQSVAKALALSLALNPGNNSSRTAIVKLTKSEPLQVAEKREKDRSQARIWNSIAWLQMPEAGPDGQALAACLGDVIAYADPQHPQAAAMLKSGSKGAWKSWIPEIASYEDPQPIASKESTENAPPAAPMPASNTLKLESAEIRTPLWMLDPITKQDVLASILVRMKAGIAPPVEGAAPPRWMSFSIDHTPEARVVTRLNREIGPALKSQFGEIPIGANAALNLGDETPYLPLRDREAISGAAAVLMSAAISGTEPTGTVIGKITADGSFLAVPDLWDRVRSLSGGPGGRLIIPSEAAEMLPSILALEDADFFLKYDVILASNLAELIERSAKEPQAPLADLLARFADVRAKGAGVPIGQYVANRFVRQRLVELSGEAAFFASPRMLAIQAAGERPTRIPRKVLARELIRALHPVEWIRGKTSAEIVPAELDRSYEIARAQVDKLERYVDTADRDFHIKVRDMTTTMRTFSRASRVGIGREDGATTIANAFGEMTKSYLETIQQLNAAAGDEETSEELPE